MYSVVHKMKVGGADGEERERQWERQICCA